jgi:hypothetical protein
LLILTFNNQPRDVENTARNRIMLSTTKRRFQNGDGITADSPVPGPRLLDSGSPNGARGNNLDWG